jgi:hypothetical protein
MRIEMLPALHGDCIFVEYSDGQRARRLLIDGGPIGSYEALEARMNALPAGDRRFELIVLSHVDTDHVDGLVRLFANPKPWAFSVQDVWFNGWRHMDPANQILGGKQGEYFSALLHRRLDDDQWNGAFDGGAVVVPDEGDLPVKKLAGGMTMTLLSPTPAKLKKMSTAWRKDIGDTIDAGDLEAGWDLLAKQKRYLPGQGLLGSTPQLDKLLERQSRPDNAAANGSSIALLVEVGEGSDRKSCLFLADAHPDVVSASLKRLLKARRIDRLQVDAVKVAHHGSKGNTTDELMSLIESPRYLISTNGAQFDHPDDEAMRRIISRSGKPLQIVFNYRSDRTEQWDEPARKRELNYTTVYPAADDEVIVTIV